MWSSFFLSLILTTVSVKMFCLSDHKEFITVNTAAVCMQCKQKREGRGPEPPISSVSKTIKASISFTWMNIIFCHPCFWSWQKVMTEVKVHCSSIAVMAKDVVKCSVSKPCNWVSCWTHFYGCSWDEQPCSPTRAGCEERDNCLKLQGGIWGIT